MATHTFYKSQYKILYFVKQNWLSRLGLIGKSNLDFGFSWILFMPKRKHFQIIYKFKEYCLFHSKPKVRVVIYCSIVRWTFVLDFFVCSRTDFTLKLNIMCMSESLSFLNLLNTMNVFWFKLSKTKIFGNIW